MVQEVLKAEKVKGWQCGIPAICIDHVHSLGSSVDLDPKKPKVSDVRSQSSLLLLICIFHVFILFLIVTN